MRTVKPWPGQYDQLGYRRQRNIKELNALFMRGR